MSGTVYNEATINSRYLDLFKIMDNFCHIYNARSEVPVEIDPALLYLVVVATYDDIARYKDYHLTSPAHQRSNAVKRASYAAKWFMHFNPLIHPSMGHISGTTITTNHSGLVNALFSVHYLLINIEDYTGKRIKLSVKTNHNLIYDLLYRSIGGDPLILVFDMIAGLVQGEQIII